MKYNKQIKKICILFSFQTTEEKQIEKSNGNQKPSRRTFKELRKELRKKHLMETEKKTQMEEL